MIKHIVIVGSIAGLALGVGGCSDDSATTVTQGSGRSIDDRQVGLQRPAAPGTVPVHRALVSMADWQIPNTIGDTMKIGDPDIQITGLPLFAAPGNEYTFDEGRGGSLTSAYLAVQVQEPASSGFEEGDTVYLEIPLPTTPSAEELASIDWGSEPWAFVVASDGAFSDGNVTSVRDLDSVENPTSLGGTSVVSVFAVTDQDEVVLPIIDEPALENESVSSTEGLGAELGQEIESGSP